RKEGEKGGRRKEEGGREEGRKERKEEGGKKEERRERRKGGRKEGEKGGRKEGGRKERKEDGGRGEGERKNSRITEWEGTFPTPYTISDSSPTPYTISDQWQPFLTNGSPATSVPSVDCESLLLVARLLGPCERHNYESDCQAPEFRSRRMPQRSLSVCVWVGGNTSRTDCPTHTYDGCRVPFRRAESRGKAGSLKSRVANSTIAPIHLAAAAAREVVKAGQNSRDRPLVFGHEASPIKTISEFAIFVLNNDGVYRLLQERAEGKRGSDRTRKWKNKRGNQISTSVENGGGWEKRGSQERRGSEEEEEGFPENCDCVTFPPLSPTARGEAVVNNKNNNNTTGSRQTRNIP
ncbi:Filensin, partial [Ophiophagus hannah]